MSKFAKQLRTYTTGTKINVDLIPCMYFRDNVTSVQFPAEEIEYRIGVTFGSTFVATLPEEKNLMKNMASRYIVEEIFGEFRQPILNAIQACSQRDMNKAIQILCELEKEMFDV